MKPKIKLNCWEFHTCNKCTHLINGLKSEKERVCITTLMKPLDGINSGKNGGRYCWAVSGSYSSSNNECVALDKYKNCKECPFYHLVKKQEGADFIPG